MARKARAKKVEAVEEIDPSHITSPLKNPHKLTMGQMWPTIRETLLCVRRVNDGAFLQTDDVRKLSDYLDVPALAIELLDGCGFDGRDLVEVVEWAKTNGIALEDLQDPFEREQKATEAAKEGEG